MPARRGRLLTVEGIDGSGKSTFVRALVEALAARGDRVEATCEPTRTWLGEAVRRALVGEEPPVVDALLFMADHAAHVARVDDLLARGVTVVSDRWSDSTFAYQGAALAGHVPTPVAWLQAVERPFDRRPDRTFLLDLAPEEALARVGVRGARREKFEELAFLRRVRRNYAALARAEPRRFVRLDARQATPTLVERALAALRPRQRS